MPKASQKVLWSKLIKSRFGLLELVGAQIPLRVHSDVLLQVISSYLRYTDVHPTVSAASTWRGPPAAPPTNKGQRPEPLIMRIGLMSSHQRGIPTLSNLTRTGRHEEDVCDCNIWNSSQVLMLWPHRGSERAEHGIMLRSKCAHL